MRPDYLRIAEEAVQHAPLEDGDASARLMLGYAAVTYFYGEALAAQRVLHEGGKRLRLNGSYAYHFLRLEYDGRTVHIRRTGDDCLELTGSWGFSTRKFVATTLEGTHEAVSLEVARAVRFLVSGKDDQAAT